MTTPSQVVLPQIIVEAALTPGQPVSGAGTMTLNDATFGKLNTDFLGGFDAWTDITTYVLSFSITRPSSRTVGPLFQFQTGTASIVLDNSTGIFDPDYAAGPYFGQIHAMVPVRIRANWGAASYGLFRGFADAWTETAVSYSAGYSEWTLSASDGSKILSGQNLATLGSPAGAGEDTGARINRILNSASWYTGMGAGTRVIDTGNMTLQATSYGDTAWNLIQLSADTELGQVYVNGAGAVVFRRRQALLTDTRSNTSQGIFGDSDTLDGYLTTYSAGYGGTGELPCAAIGRADDDTTIANDIQATRTGGTMQEVTDAASIATYLFPRTYSRSDLIMQDDPTALQWAGSVLYIAKTGEDRFESVSVDPLADPADLWPQVLGRDIGDRITVNKRPPPSLSTAISRDGFITAITHMFDAGAQTWLTTWGLADASKYGSFLTLNNATLGQLNFNALAF